MKFKKLIPMVLLLLSSACQENPGSSAAATADTAGIANQTLATETGNDSAQLILLNDTICLIEFEDFSLQIPNFHYENMPISSMPIKADIFWITAEVGENFEDRILYINSEKVNDLIVEESYETSISIMDEGPHCDLTEWEHYIGEWRPLHKNHLEEYPLYTYSEKESQKFPAISMEQLRAAVAKHCEQEWAEKIKNIQSPTEYPSSVGISRYYIRISGKRKTDGTAFQKTLVIKSPMGC